MFIQTLFKKIAGLFTSGKAQRAFAEVERILPRVIDVVEKIAAITPNRTDDEIVAAFQKFGVPIAHDLATNPPDALRKLAQQLIVKVVPNTQASIINLAIETAVVGLKK